jgi:hypothetical protein
VILVDGGGPELEEGQRELLIGGGAPACDLLVGGGEMEREKGAGTVTGRRRRR